MIAIGGYSLVFMDEFIYNLLTEERVCDIIMPRIAKRQVLEENGELGPRKSRLLAAMEGDSDHESDKDRKRSRSRSRSMSVKSTQSRGRSLNESRAKSRSPSVGSAESRSRSPSQPGSRYVSRSPSRSVSRSVSPHSDKLNRDMDVDIPSWQKLYTRMLLLFLYLLLFPSPQLARQ